MRIKLFYSIAIAILSPWLCSYAQLKVESGATLFIGSGATVTVQGNVASSADLQGTGTLLLKGTTTQQLDMGGFTVPNLKIENANNASLTSNCRIGNSLEFTAGKILLGNNNMQYASIATSLGMGTGKFLETNGTGEAIQEITANITSREIPLGGGSVYRPAFISSIGTYSNGKVGVQSLAVKTPNAPPSISDFTNCYWPVTRSGITGTVTLDGQYADADIAGTESFLNGYYFNGTDWSSTGQAANNALNRVSAPVTVASGELTAIDKFDLAKIKVYLQGAYQASGIMSDALRAGTNVIPLSDPYRTAPYSSNFTHTGNLITETAAAAVFNTNAITSDNIVDWVFVEVRNNNASPGNSVIQTRSALLQRDGDVVDVDGVSPLTFNRLATGSYTIAVRHRNHLGLSTDPSSFTQALAETKSTIVVTDFSTATDAQLFGTAAAFATSSDGRIMLWGGNANFNGNTRYSGLNNDKDYLLVNTLGSNSGGFISNIYSSADLNMNKIVRHSGLNNDKDFLLINVLASNSGGTRTQVLPN